jgi:hypothetical protein
MKINKSKVVVFLIFLLIVVFSKIYEKYLRPEPASYKILINTELRGVLYRKPFNKTRDVLCIEYSDSNNNFRSTQEILYDVDLSHRFRKIAEKGDSIYSGKGDSMIKIFKRDSVFTVHKLHLSDTVYIPPYPRTDIKK